MTQTGADPRPVPRNGAQGTASGPSVPAGHGAKADQHVVGVTPDTTPPPDDASRPPIGPGAGGQEPDPDASFAQEQADPAESVVAGDPTAPADPPVAGNRAEDPAVAGNRAEDPAVAGDPAEPPDPTVAGDRAPAGPPAAEGRRRSRRSEDPAEAAWTPPVFTPLSAPPAPPRGVKHFSQGLAAGLLLAAVAVAVLLLTGVLRWVG